MLWLQEGIVLIPLDIAKGGFFYYLFYFKSAAVKVLLKIEYRSMWLWDFYLRCFISVNINGGRDCEFACVHFSWETKQILYS